VAQHIGLTPFHLSSDVAWTMASDFVTFPPKRDAFSHKGSYGHLAIVGGSTGFHGAAVMAARAALRAHPGLVTLYAPEAVYPISASHLDQAMVQPFSDNLKLPDTISALVVGPGLADPKLSAGTKEWIKRTWCEAPFPIIADASALDWLPAGPIPDDTTRVITPHPGEAARMLKVDKASILVDRCGSVRKLSEKYGSSWVVLKGHQTLIGQTIGQIFYNSTGNPYLAQGGSGDVLAGYLGGLLAQPSLQYNPLQSLTYAVWQHGLAADLLSATRHNWVMDDLISKIGDARVDQP
jgi:ADP-dependent NAD(P)H-hydrate dehydratase / NAD(P)H-hydrate epimerase